MTRLWLTEVDRVNSHKRRTQLLWKGYSREGETIDLRVLLSQIRGSFRVTTRAGRRIIRRDIYKESK